MGGNERIVGENIFEQTKERWNRIRENPFLLQTAFTNFVDSLDSANKEGRPWTKRQWQIVRELLLRSLPDQELAVILDKTYLATRGEQELLEKEDETTKILYDLAITEAEERGWFLKNRFGSLFW